MGNIFSVPTERIASRDGLNILQYFFPIHITVSLFYILQKPYKIQPVP
jgi:hypothetical protein